MAEMQNTSQSERGIPEAMLVVFHSINAFSVVPALITGLFSEVYFLRLSGDLCKSNTFARLSAFFNLRPLPLEGKKHLQGMRYYDFGFEDIVHGQAERMLPMSIIQNLDKSFEGISKLESKLKLALATSFNYHDVGAIALYISSESPSKPALFIHTSFVSYWQRENGVKGADRFHHALFPSADFERLWVKSKQLILKMLTIRRKVRTRHLPESHHAISSLQTTAIIYHSSINYGQMFRKLHYFSSEPHSRLHLSQVTCFVLDRYELFQKLILDDEPVLIDMVRIHTIKDIFDGLYLLVSKLRNVKTFNELSGLIFLVRFFYSYRAWCRTLHNYPNLKNVIIDYDILFPKSLALALESFNIRTIALQERGSTSFASIYGTIVDTYLFSGGIFTEYGNRNKSIACRIPVNFGQWRTSLFFSKELPDFYELSYLGFNKRNIRDFSTVICCLGWYTAQENSITSMFISTSSSLELYSRVKSLALRFSNSAVVLRLKLLSDSDRCIICDLFSDADNVFLCDEYSKMNASYSLCKKADVIVSVQTSLAEECLAVGKKVVLLDSTHNFKSICTDIYPKDFHFAIADDLEQIIALVSRCMQDDVELTLKYKELREKLMGDFDLGAPNMIPNTIEKYLQ